MEPNYSLFFIWCIPSFRPANYKPLPEKKRGRRKRMSNMEEEGEPMVEGEEGDEQEEEEEEVEEEEVEEEEEEELVEDEDQQENGAANQSGCGGGGGDQSQEWEAMAGAWLRAFPEAREVNATEVESWIDCNRSFLPFELKSMERSELIERLLSIQNILRIPPDHPTPSNPPPASPFPPPPPPQVHT